MRRLRLPILAALMIGSIAACDGRDPVDDGANALGPAEVTNDSAGAVAGAPPAAADNGTPGSIPTALQGRWGLTPADCISNRGDAKGLLEIGPDHLKFYESRATPSTSIESGDDGISGNFNFTGEGQTWSKYVSLKMQGDGLVRTERNPMASYTYVKCD